MYILLIYHLELDWFSQLFLIDLSIYRFHLCSSSFFQLTWLIFSISFIESNIFLFLYFLVEGVMETITISRRIYLNTILVVYIYICIEIQKHLNICSKNICLRHYNLFIYFLYLSAVINRLFSVESQLAFNHVSLGEWDNWSGYFPTG